MSDLTRFANVLIDNGLTEEALRGVLSDPLAARICALVLNQITDSARRKEATRSAARHAAYKEDQPSEFARARINAGYPTYTIATALGVGPARINEAENIERFRWRNFKPTTLAHLNEIRDQYRNLFPELREVEVLET